MRVYDSRGIQKATGGGGGGITNINVSAGTTNNDLSNLVFTNGSGVSFGLNGSTISASVQTNYLSAVRISAGTTSQLMSAVTFANSNGVSFGLNGSVVTATVQTNYLTTAMASNRGSDFVQATATIAGTNITGTIASNGLSLSVAAPAGSINISAGTTSNLLTAVTFANANGFSFGLDGSTVTGSYTVPVVPAQSNQTLGLYASSNTTLTSSGTVDARIMSFRAIGSLTIGYSAGELVFSAPAALTTAQPPGAYLTTAALSQDSSKYAGINGAITGGSITVNTSGVSINLPAYLTTAQSPGAYLTTARASNDAVGLNTALTANGVAWTVNSSGISLNVPAFLTTAMASNRGSDFVQATAAFAGTNASGTIASGGISISVNAGGVQSNQTLGLYMSSNTTSSVSSGTVDARSMTFRGMGIASVGYSGGEVIFSVPAGVAAEQNAVNLLGANTAGNTTATGSTLGFSGVNLTLSGTNNSQIVFSAPATTSLSASTNITLSVTGSTIQFSVGDPVLVREYMNQPSLLGAQTMAPLQSTSHVVPFDVPVGISFDIFRLLGSGSPLGASTTWATTGNTSYSGMHFRTHNIVIYSRGVGANSQSLQLVLSTSQGETHSFRWSHAATNSTQFSASMRYTFPGSAGAIGFTKDYSSSLAGSANIQTSHLTDLTGLKQLDMQFAGSLTPGRYWLAYGISSTTSTQFTAQLTRGGIAFSQYAISQTNAAFGTLGANTDASVMPMRGVGSLSTGGAAGTTASVPLANISSSASHNALYLQLLRSN